MLVLIEWYDITGVERPWLPAEEAIELDPVIVQTVGWLYNKDDHCVRIAASRHTDPNTYGNINVIPRGCIVNMRCLDTTCDGVDKDECPCLS